MPYVERDSNNKIIGVYNNFQEGYAEEYVEDTDEEYLAFMKQFEPPSDLQIARNVKTNGFKVTLDAILATGLKYSILGEEYSYSCTIDNRAFIMEAYLDGLTNSDNANWTTQLLCKSADGNWSYVEHTFDKIKEIQLLVKNYALTQTIIFNQLSTNVKNATTIEEVNAIFWPTN